MKILSVFIVCSSLFFASCSKSAIEHKKGLDKSADALDRFKAASGNSYLFVTTGGSWAGTSWRTEIRVNNGVATERKFVYTSFAGVQMPETGWNEEKRQEILTTLGTTGQEFLNTHGRPLEEILGWVEEASGIGTHKNTAASPYLTLDAVYEEAKNEWLKKRENAETIFETGSDGLISTCGYTINGCQDDCFTGIRIVRIEAL